MFVGLFDNNVTNSPLGIPQYATAVILFMDKSNNKGLYAHEYVLHYKTKLIESK